MIFVLIFVSAILLSVIQDYSTVYSTIDETGEKFSDAKSFRYQDSRYWTAEQKPYSGS